MIRILTAAAVAALASPLVHAASYSVPVSGTYTAEYDTGVFPDKCPVVPNPCFVSTSFGGSLQVTTPDSASGTYTSGVSVSYDFGDVTGLSQFDSFLASSPANGEVTATIVDGWLTDLSALAGGDLWQLTLSQGALDWQSAGSHLGATATGTYALPAPVPEPAPAALLALAVAGFALRRVTVKRGVDRASAATLA